MKKIFSTLLVAMMCAMSYAQTEISEMVAGQTTLDLTAGTEYTLNAEAILGVDVVTINGNGATIKVGEAGKFSIQKGIVLNDVVLDASATNNAVLELSATPDASLATFVTEGETTTYKYEGANQKVYEAQNVTLNGCTFITNNSVIRPGAAWALRNLNINNSIIEVKYKSGKAIINMEENSGNSIQNISISNSTIYADDPATDMRFIRYSSASNAQSQKVWGKDDNNASLTLENNTFVGVCGNKEFANNYVNNKLYQLTFKNNAFVNTWRIQKIGANNTRNFEQADNLIMGGTQAVDGTDAKWFTAVDDLGVVWNFGDAVPAATDMAAMGLCFGLYEDYKTFGDPRWAAYSTKSEISEMLEDGFTLNLKPGKEYTLNAPANLHVGNITVVNGNGATIKVGSEGKFSIQKGIVLNDVVLDASGSANSALELSATPDASLATFTTEGETTTYKYEGANQKVYEAQNVTLNGCTFITNNSVIRPGAAWALRNLNINNSIIEVKYKSGKAIINMEENGGNSIQNICIKNSTLYADDPATEMYFIRYNNASNAQSQKVWGKDDNNASLTLENNTFVGISANKNFADRYVNNKLYQFTFKGNAFVNTWRINKLGANNTRNFEQADNVIMGGTNAVDGTDANWFTAVDDLGVVWNFGEAAPAATDVKALGAAFGMFVDYKTFGDPRWETYSTKASFLVVDNADGTATITPNPETASYVVAVYPVAEKASAFELAGLSEEASNDDFINALNNWGFFPEVTTGVSKFNIVDFLDMLGETLVDGAYTFVVSEVVDDVLQRAVSKTLTISYTPTGINNVATENSNVVRYNLAGQRVNASAKGIVIVNGKKHVVK